jgi:DNA-binding transcriptional ArsR family regulator
MVNYSGSLDSTFSALSDSTRRAILARLALGEASVSELAAPFPVSLPAISKQLRVLESAGLIRRYRDGRVHRCRLDGVALKNAADWIDHYRRFWQTQLDALSGYLEEKRAWTRKASASGGPTGRPGRKSLRRGRARRR